MSLFENLEKKTINQDLNSPYVEEEIFYFGSSYFEQKINHETLKIKLEFHNFLKGLMPKENFELTLSMDSVYSDINKKIAFLKKNLMLFDRFFILGEGQAKIYLKIKNDSYSFYVEKFMIGGTFKSDAKKIHDIELNKIREKRIPGVETFKFLNVKKNILVYGIKGTRFYFEVESSMPKNKKRDKRDFSHLLEV